MAPVDEDEARVYLRPVGDGSRVTDHGDYQVLGAGGLDCFAPGEQSVEAARFKVDERFVVIFPSGLVLLRAVMVVDAEHEGGRRPGADGVGHTGGQVEAGAPAIGSDLDQRLVSGDSGAPGECRERSPFVVGHETLGLSSR